MLLGQLLYLLFHEHWLFEQSEIVHPEEPRVHGKSITFFCKGHTCASNSLGMPRGVKTQTIV